MKSLTSYSAGLACLLFALQGFLACNAASDSAETSAQSDLIKSWQYEVMEVNGDTIDLKSVAQPILEFRANGTFIQEMGYMRDSGTWRMQGQDTLLTITENNETEQSMLIQYADADSLVLEALTGDTSLQMKLTLIPYKKDS